MAQLLRFDEERRQFFLGDTELKSVTQILKDAGRIDTRWFDEESRIRGQAVHHGVFLDVDGDLDLDTIHPIVAPYMPGWFDFKAVSRFRPIVELCEKRQFHPVYLYVGKPDLVGLLNGGPAVIDVKTGNSKTAGLQTAAYADFPEIAALGKVRRFSLTLRRDGKFRLNEYTSANDLLEFHQCMVHGAR